MFGLVSELLHYYIIVIQGIVFILSLVGYLYLNFNNKPLHITGLSMLYPMWDKKKTKRLEKILTIILNILIVSILISLFYTFLFTLLP